EKTWGYDATLLADVCDVYLDAQEAGVLRENQQHIAKRCLTLSRGFMRIGIIALVDEATGYQRARSIGELREKLAQLIMEEPTPTDKRRRDLLRLLFQDKKVFPNDFYEALFAIRGWTWTKADPAHGPRAVAMDTRDLVYMRIEQGLLKELEKKNPMIDGDRDMYHHQFFHESGLIKLRMHIASVTNMMKQYPTPKAPGEARAIWKAFKRGIDRALPRKDTAQMPMQYDA